MMFTGMNDQMARLEEGCEGRSGWLCRRGWSRRDERRALPGMCVAGLQLSTLLLTTTLSRTHRQPAARAICGAAGRAARAPCEMIAAAREYFVSRGRRLTRARRSSCLGPSASTPSPSATSPASSFHFLRNGQVPGRTVSRQRSADARHHVECAQNKSSL